MERQPAGTSVEIAASIMHSLIDRHEEKLRAEFGADIAVLQKARSRDFDYYHPWGKLAVIYADEMLGDLRSRLLESGLAVVPNGDVTRAVAGPMLSQRGMYRFPGHSWLLMHKKLVSAYSSVLASDFASANKLTLTTDQQDAYRIGGEWTPDVLVAILFNDDSYMLPAPESAMTETVAFLALNLVIPANIHSIPMSKLIEVRRRYGTNFLSFGAEIDKLSAELANLSDVRDQAVLNGYLNDVVANRFSSQLKELRRQIRGLGMDSATMAINIKTQLPAGTGLAAGAVLLGHPALASGIAVAVGATAMRESVRQKRSKIPARLRL